MKRVASLILLLFFTFLVFRPAIPLFEYCLRKDYIAKVLCINKEKPQLKCNGKCHLSKQLKAEIEEEQDSPFPAKKDKNQKQLSEFLSVAINYLTVLRQKSSPQTFFQNLYSFSFSLFVFHPPG